MAVIKNTALDREILRPLWKVHILHHAAEGPIVANWMLEELREHGYRVSPGTLYPLLDRLERLGWLRRASLKRGQPPQTSRPYRLTPAGRRVLATVRQRLHELLTEACPPPKS